MDTCDKTVERMKEKCNWRGISTLLIITVCLVSVMSPAMTQTSFSLFNNASNDTDGEIPEPTSTPTPSPTPTSTQTPTPGPSSSPTPSPTPTPSPPPTSCPTPSPTSIPTPSPTPTPSPSPTPSPAPTMPPTIISFAPDSPVYDVEGAARTFNITIDQAVNVSWLINGTGVFHQTNITESAYTNISAAAGTWNVSAIAINHNGTAMQKWDWIVTAPQQPAAPNIISLAPDSPVYDIEGTARTFNITIDQIANITWLINEKEVLINESEREASYTNNSAIAGVWYVSAIIPNTNGTVIQTGIWNVSSQAMPAPTLTPGPTPTFTPKPTPTPSPAPTQTLTSGAPPSIPFLIYGFVSYKNGTACNAPFVAVTNTNTSEEFIAENRTSVSFYQLATSSTNVSVDDVLQIEASKNGISVGNASHIITDDNISQGIIEVNINEGMPDLTIRNLTIDTDYPIAGELVNVTATIANDGSADANSNALFYDEKNLSIFKFYWNISGFQNNGNDTIIQPGALKIRVHFIDMGIQGEGSYVKVYNENNTVIDKFAATNQTDFWTHWSTAEKIRMESHATDHLYFMIDKYEVLFANKTVSLGAGQFTDVKAAWNGSAWLNSADIASGNHIIRVEVAPVMNESNTENNNMSMAVTVKPVSIDLEVTNISLDKTPLDGDLVNITVAVINNGVEDAINFTVIFKDGIGKGNISGEVFNETIILSLGANNSTNITTSWNATFGYHTMTVMGNPENAIPELTETNNQKSISVCVNASRDFAVTNISFISTINNKSVDPTNLTTGKLIFINATVNITNLANRDGSVEVSCYLDNTSLLNTTTVQFDTNNGTSYAIFEWRAGIVKGHIITVIADPDNETVELNESNNIFSQSIYVDAPDLTMMDLTIVGYEFCPTMTAPACNYLNIVTAAIVNKGNVSANTSVEFYAEKDISIIRLFGGYNKSRTDVITQPEANKIRVHFSSIIISPGTNSYVTIFDKDNNTVGTITVDKSEDYWCNWVGGDTIKIYSHSGSASGNITFLIDKYEYAFANTTISLSGNDSKIANSTWYALAATITNETNLSRGVMLGKYNISVIADPGSRVIELDETNNKTICEVYVFPSWDFEVTNITFIPENPREGEVVTINASIKNLGFRSISTTVAFYVDGNPLAIRDVYADGNKTNYVEANWTAGPSFFHRTPEHNITVSGDPDNKITESDESNNKMSKLIALIPSANLTIVNLTFDPADPIVGSPVKISATIMNEGNASENCTTWFYLGNYLDYETYNWKDTPRLYNKTITYPGAYAIQAHFEYANKSGYEPRIEVYDGDNNLVEGFTEDLDDQWTIWCRGDTITIKAHNYKCGYIDKYRVPLGNKTANLKHGDSVDCIIVWNATQGNHTLWVQVNDNITGRDVFVSGTDLAVVNVSVVKDQSVVNDVWDGDQVNVTANITNIGRRDAGNFTVNFTDNGELFNVTDVSGLYAGDSIDLVVSWNASLKSGTEVAYNHTIQVKIDPCNNTENSDENDCNDTIVHVKRSCDFSVTSISFTANSTYINSSELVLGELVTLNATVNITNLANSGGNVDVGFYLDEIDDKHLINKTFVNKTFDKGLGNGTVHASLDWWVVNLDDDVSVLGDHNITVIADPENKTIELDENNNASRQEIHVKAPDFAVTNITLVPVSPEEGKLVDITATVINNGDKNVSNAIVTFVDKWKNNEFPITNLTTSLNISENKSISVNWTAIPAGSHEITTSIEAENVPKHDLTKIIVVRGADLTVSNLWLTVNGTEVTDNGTIKHDDVLNITANITNIGIRPANGFNLSFFVDDILLNATLNAVLIDIGQKDSINASAIWNATVGNYMIKVVADLGDKIAETNESNNTMSRSVGVQGADLLVSNANITFMVIPPENATNVSTTNAASNAIFDTDIVMINATIANQGILPAENFTTPIFYEYASLEGFSRAASSMGYCGKKLPEECWQWKNRSYDGAECILVYIEDKAVNINNNLKIFDKNDNVTASPTKSGWIPVRGDTVKIHYNDVHGVGFNIHFYAGNITKIQNLSLYPNELMNVSMIHSVSNGNHQVRVFVDLENNVTEHDEGNNIASKIMHVNPSRDFTADMRLFHNGTEISANDTVWDGDTVMINATVGMRINESDPYNKPRKGIVEVEIINEHEWVNVSPRYELTDYGYAQVITYPSADAIRVHFAELDLPSNGFVEIKDKEGRTCWSKHNFEGSNINSSWINRDKVYVCREKGPYYGPVGGRITFVIDKYQYKKSNHTAVPLNASETKSITPEWNVRAGNHTMRVTADPEDKIGEINESNNEISKTLLVNANKDPAVIDITFNPEKPAIGSDVAINAIVANKGNKTANFSVDLWAVKTEYHPFESPHDSDFPYWSCEGEVGCGWKGKGEPKWEINTTYPEADWMGVHFTRINTTTPPDTEWRRLYADDEKDNRIEYFNYFDEADIWVWAKGNKIKLETSRGNSSVWGFSIDYHSYKIILNRIDLTLAPNETANVTGILKNIRAGNRSMSYTIHATVDMGNVVYETNESNNEMIRILDIHVPDLTVHEIVYEGEITAKIENIGFGAAQNVSVRFMRDVKLKYPMGIKGGSSVRSISSEDEDTDAMRVHVEYLYVDEDEDEDSYLQIGNERYEKDDKDGFWSPWMDGDSIALWWGKAEFKIDRYEYGVDERVGDFVARGPPKGVEVPDKFIVENEAYNLTVFADPENEIREGNEGNNKEEKMVGPDITFEWPGIIFINEERDPVARDKLLADDKYTVKVKVKNSGCLPAANFYVTLYLNKSINETISSFPKYKNISLLKPGDLTSVEFPSLQLDSGFYYVKAVVDENNNVSEVNEGNNIYPPFPSRGIEVKVAPESGYKAKEGYMPMFREGETEFHGGIIYDAEHTSELRSGQDDATLNTTFGDPVPANATVTLARLYVYTTMGHYEDEESHWMAFVPTATQLIVTFNDIEVKNPTIYPDVPDATNWNVSYGTYCYNVNYEKGRDNLAIATRTNLPQGYEFGMNGMALLIIYGDEDAPLIRYWVAEDRDIMMAKNKGFDTGLEYSECTRKVRFNGISDSHLANATLKTVLVSYITEQLYPEAKEKADALYFNPPHDTFEHPYEMDIPRVSGGTPLKGHWKKVGGDIALTDPSHTSGWEYVDVQDVTNTAGIQSRGAFMGVAHAILKLTYYPDLVRPDLPSEVEVGESIPVVIRNRGKSDARHFNVSFYMDGEELKDKEQHVGIVRGVENPDSKNYEELTFPWVPSQDDVGRHVALNVSVDSRSNVTELHENNNDATKNVTVAEKREEELPWSLRGGTGGSGGGRGEGTGTGEGADEGGGAGTQGGGEGAVGERGGKAITGRLMKGSVAPSEAEGGGKGEEFSMLGLLLRLGMLVAAVFLLFIGYLLERRRHLF
ncbi:hypothetical protein C5S32_06675 [ANME-1 cluster archaeon GoMg1]|nr:hypothetical protein [ANME-1 cluster archaeon GoMg1]